MTPGRLDEVADQLAHARELGDAEREGFLSELEARDSGLAFEVRRLLASKALSGDFLDPPRQGAIEEPMRLLSLDFRGMKLGEFELVREIGRGAAGVVYLGEQPSLKRRVAIKVLVPQLSNTPRVRERFEREALAASRLRHEAIVSVLAFGEFKGVLYLAMEFVEGTSLHQHIEALRVARKSKDQPGPSTIDVSQPQAAARIAEQLADALRYCHGEGVLHRDIKPQNILLDEDGRPRIVDFGLAKDVRIEGLTEQGQVSGTLHYMSPEQAQARSDELDARTDIYSLGVVLYEMLTLRRPLDGRTDAELLQRVLNRRPVPPHHLDERIPRALSAICMRALRKLPGERYEDAEALAKDLRAFQGGRRVAVGMKLGFEDAYRYVFVKRPWIGVAGLVVLFGVGIVLAPKALTSNSGSEVRATDAHSVTAPQARLKTVEALLAQARTPEERAEMEAQLVLIKGALNEIHDKTTHDGSSK